MGDRQPSSQNGAAPARPVLDLSGPHAAARLREPGRNRPSDTGGVERYVGALALKASLFEEVLGKGRVGELTETEFCDLAAFITPVRRRIGAWLGGNGFAAMRRRLVALLDGWSDVGTADQRHRRPSWRAFPPTASTAGRATSPPRCCTSPRPSAIR